jgi:hypothetical protein
VTRRPTVPPENPPPSAGVLGKLVRLHARGTGVAEGRVRAWLAYMMLLGRLEQQRVEGTGRRFTLKGGVALELRLRDRARATKDIDLVLHDENADLADMFDQALLGHPDEGCVVAADYQGFGFRRKQAPIRLDNGTVSIEVAVTYRGNEWTSITVDIARAEAGESEIEELHPMSLTGVTGIPDPAALPCLPLRLHIAQKLHGMTLPPRPGKQNYRVKDLVDLVLLKELITDYAGLREACELVFRTRATHAWPPTMELPRHWAAPYARFAEELDLAIPDASTALAEILRLVKRIDEDQTRPSA